MPKHPAPSPLAVSANFINGRWSTDGDGTVNEVAQGLIGSDVPLGLLPSGSGDGLARGLGIPADVPRAFDVALSGATIRMDVGYANNRLFLNSQLPKIKPRMKKIMIVI